MEELLNTADEIAEKMKEKGYTFFNVKMGAIGSDFRKGIETYLRNVRNMDTEPVFPIYAGTRVSATSPENPYSWATFKIVEDAKKGLRIDSMDISMYECNDGALRTRLDLKINSVDDIPSIQIASQLIEEKWKNLKENNHAAKYYEEYRGYVIAPSESEGPDNTFRSSAAVYYKDESADYAFIIAGSDSKESGQPVQALVGDAREYIDDLCCHELNQGIERSGTALPIIELQGTDFFVDVTRFQLIEKFDSKNIIPFQKIIDYGDYYIINYNEAIKNVTDYPGKNDTEILMKQFVDLDPEGMAKKYKISVDEVKNKTDFDFMVDQNEFDLRVNKGQLPTIDIYGHLFYVDIRMDKLRPKDDFSSNGIVFSDIEDYYSDDRNSYLIPYDPKKREFRELDYENITSIPTDLIAVEFPFQDVLDPIGWNRGLGWDIKENLKHIGVQGHFDAKVVDWKHTYIVDIIKDNLERLKPQEEKNEIKEEPKISKGRKR